MANQTPEPTEAQIQAFGQKLQAFAVTLTPEEQAILESILRLAMGEEDEVQGYAAASTMAAPQRAWQPQTMASVASVLTNLTQMRHESLKGIAQNLRG